MINLNDASFDGGNGSKIFNNNVAGIVENVTLSVEKKKADDKEKAPDYKLVFTDANGAVTNLAYWFITEASAYKTVEQQIASQGKMMKHILHAIYGASYELPPFADAVGMLNGCMKLINEGVKAGGKFRIFMNFGTTSSVKGYVQPRSWVPMMEPMTVPLAETRLEESGLDAMVKMTPDALPLASANDLTASDDGDDW